MAITTKTGVTVETNYCRKCMRNLPAKEFYECVDTGFIDSNGLLSACKNCIQDIYDKLYAENNSMEKTIHKICTSLNIMFSNEAVSATKAHINTLLGNGKNVNAIFSIYKMKLTATKKSMDKSGLEDMTYEDVGAIFTEKQIDTTTIPLPAELVEKWGRDLSRADIEFLENQYIGFCSTHKDELYSEKVLLKEVCYTMLKIKDLRAGKDPDTTDAVKELQTLMKSLAISPNIANSGEKGVDSFGLWIQDIERSEPAQWLKTDPRGDMYRDVGNVEEYFLKYIVRPLKNFITGSKDFNVDDTEIIDDDEFTIESEEKINFNLINDGEVEKEG